jgi:vacuolar iron transporter family protein
LLLGTLDGCRLGRRPDRLRAALRLRHDLEPAVPLITIAFAPAEARISVAIAVTLIALCALGVAGARIGGAPIRRGALRVVIGGAVAMGVTMGIGALVGTAV